MLFDEERKTIFIRHQKTASTSIMSGLRLPVIGRQEHAELCKYIYLKTGKKYDGNHVPLFELKNIDPKVYENKSDYFKFGFTRNPWDRLLSAWKFAFVAERSDAYEFRIAISFRKFIKDYRDTWLGVEMNTLDFCNGCDFIGKFENLQKDFDTICDKIGISKQELSCENALNHKHYTEYYDDDSRKIVAEKYAKDIEYFGYKFGE